jgi:hypothetical protein
MVLGQIKTQELIGGAKRRQSILGFQQFQIQNGNKQYIILV